MEAIAAAASYVGSAFAASAAGTATVAQTLTVIAVNTAASVALSAVATAINKPEVNVDSATEWIADTDAPLFFPFGKVGAAGQVVYKKAWGKDNRLLSIVSVLAAAGPINSFVSFTADDVAVTFSGANGDASGHYADLMWRSTSLGAQPATALESPDLGYGALPGWGAAYKLNGKAAYMLTMVQNADRDAYPTGEPRPINVFEGLKAWDPRADSTWPGGTGSQRLLTPSTWVYSTNPIICALKWATGMWEGADGSGGYGTPYASKQVGGIGASLEAIDVEAFIAAANIADANGWTVAAYPNTAQDKHEVLKGLLQAGGAIYSTNAGKISCISRGAAKTSVVTVTGADTAGPIEVDLGVSRIARVNTISARFWSEDNNWQMAAIADVTDSGWRTEDGGVMRRRRIDYPFVPDKTQAAQLAILDAANTREPITGTIPFKPHMQQLRPGDAFTIDEPGFALDGQKCLCLTTEYDPMSAVVRVGFVSETDEKFTIAGVQAPDDPAPYVPDPVDRTTPDPPTSGEWSLAGGVVGTGVTQPALIVTGASGNAYAVQVLVDYRVDGDTDWIDYGSQSADATRIEITGVQAVTAYEVGLRYRTSWGSTSTRLVLGPVTTGGLNAGSADEVEWDNVQTRPTWATDGRAAYQLAAELFPDPSLNDLAIWASLASGAGLSTPAVISPPMASAMAMRLLASASLTNSRTVAFEITDDHDLLLSAAFAQVGAFDAATSGRLRYQTFTGPGGTGSLGPNGYVTLTASENGRYSAVIPTAGTGVQSMWVYVYRNAGGLRDIQWGEITVRPVRTLPPELVFEDGSRMEETTLAARSRSAGVNPNATHRQSNGLLSAMSGQPEKVSAEDGVPVTFASTHAAPPLVIPIYDNLDAPAATEYLRMRADDLTTTGFTPVIEWVEPPTSPTYAARSDDTPAVTGAAQTLERQKALNGVAYDGEYIARGKFKAEGDSVGIVDPVNVTIGFYGRQTLGGAWTLLGTSVGLVADGLRGSGLVKTFGIIGTSAWATWNVHGNTEYRIMMTAGYFAGQRELTEFTSVTYTEQTGGSGGGSRPALSNDRTAPFSVIPVGA